MLSCMNCQRKWQGKTPVELYSCIAEMYDSIGHKWMHAYVWKYGLINKVKDMQFSKEAYVKKHKTQALNVAWIAWPLLLTSLNNRSLSCAEISWISAEHLAINRCEFERRCKSVKKRVPTWVREIAK